MENQADTVRELRVGVRELQGNLTRYLREAREEASILVASHDAVITETRPPAPKHRALRQFGMLRGQIWMTDDFDTLPDDALAAMEGLRLLLDIHTLLWCLSNDPRLRQPVQVHILSVLLCLFYLRQKYMF